MKNTIEQAGAKVLAQKSKPVRAKDISSPKIKNVIKKMRTALKPEEKGVALAAPQIDEPLRIFIVAGKVFAKEDSPDVNAGRTRKRQGEREENPPQTATPPDMVFINPEFVRISRKKKALSEGCLSVRGVFGTVVRHEKASIKALDEHGKHFVYHGSGLLAQIFQHEMDHLEGILFIEKAEKLEKPQT